jgi:hypothetical protein
MRTIALVVLALAASACAGAKAREHVLLPAVRMAWPAVQDDVLRGIEDGIADGELTSMQVAELQSRTFHLGMTITASYDPDAFAVAGWNTLEPWAHRGIQDRVDDHEIGPGVAESFRERVLNFSAAIERLAEDK